MSDEVTPGETPQEPIVPLEPQEPVAPVEPPEDKFEIKGKKIVINDEEYEPERALELIQKQRQFEKDLKKANEKLQKFEHLEQERKKAELSEIDRLKLEKQEAEQKLADLTRKEQRREIAEKVKLPFALADRIKGETPEEMEADAKQLFESLPKPVTPKTGVTNPGAQAKEPAVERLNSDIDPFDPAWVKAHGGGAILKE